MGRGAKLYKVLSGGVWRYVLPTLKLMQSVNLAVKCILFGEEPQSPLLHAHTHTTLNPSELYQEMNIAVDSYMLPMLMCACECGGTLMSCDVPATVGRLSCLILQYTTSETVVYMM